MTVATASPLSGAFAPVRFVEETERIRARIRLLTPSQIHCERRDKHYARKKTGMEKRFDAELTALLIGAAWAGHPEPGGGTTILAGILADAALAAGLEKGTPRDELVAFFDARLRGRQP